MQLAEEFDETEEVVAVPPEDVVAEKNNLLSKLHSIEKKDEFTETTFSVYHPVETKKTVIEPLRPPPRKIEVSALLGMDYLCTYYFRLRLQLNSHSNSVLFAFQVSEEEVKARQEYLKQQRDKLLALKKQVREKRLGAAETDDDAAGDYIYPKLFSSTRKVKAHGGTTEISDAFRKTETKMASHIL